MNTEALLCFAAIIHTSTTAEQSVMLIEMWPLFILQLPFSHPLTYVEYLIQQLTELQINVGLDSLYSISIKVLDVAYIRHHEIYLKLFHMITGRWERTPRER